jgi:hypothetical protein
VLTQTSSTDTHTELTRMKNVLFHSSYSKLQEDKLTLL